MLKYIIYGIVLIELVSSENHDEAEIAKVNNSMNKGLDYINNHPHNFNVDGMFGITLAIANLRAILAKGIKDDPVVDLEQKSKRVFDTIYPVLHAEGFDEIFKRVLLDADLWAIKDDFKSNNLNATFERNVQTLAEFEQYMKAQVFNETMSDTCITNLLDGIKPANNTRLRKNSHGSRKRKCHFSPDCKKLMLEQRPTDSGYVISHKLLYLLIARSTGCKLNMKWYRKKVRSCCNVMLWEVQTMTKLNFPKKHQDLFLEHLTLCGYAGFDEFMDKKFMNNVFQMQTSEGCFNKLAQRRAANLDTNYCIDHTNGLGVSTAATYLRYLLT